MKTLPLDRAVTIAGSQAELAARITALMRADGALAAGDNDIQQQHVAYWLKAGTPPKYCRYIEAITNGVVTCQQLRPDIFAPVPTRDEGTPI